MGEAKQEADDDAAATEYARYLGIEPGEDAEMMWIAKEALTAEVPDGWTECNEDGQTFYFHEAEDRSSWEHPMDAHYKELVKETRRSSLPQEQDSSFGYNSMMDGSAVGMGSPPKFRTRAQAATPDPMVTTSVTPGICFVLPASTSIGLPPAMGLRLTTARCIPGRSTSTPNSAIPVDLAIPSIRGKSLPMYFHADFGFRGDPDGNGSAAAALAN